MTTTHFIKQPRSGPLVGLISEKINFSTSGDNTVIAAEVGRHLRIHKLFLVGRAASDIQFWSGPSAEGDSRSGVLPFMGNFGLAFDGDEFTLELGLGKAFVISSTVAIQIGGWISYTRY